MPKDLGALAANFGQLNEITSTVCLFCALAMTREQIVAALKPEREGGRLVLPVEHPLDAFALEDGPHGPIPPKVEFKDFVWQGGADSWRTKPLRRFASFTSGRAMFILIDVDGAMHPYEIEDGKLFPCDVALAFLRRGAAGADKSVKLARAVPLLKAGVALGQRSADAGA